MSSKSAAAPQMIGELALKLAELPDDDLRLVAEFVDCLEDRRPALLSAEEIREEARRLARRLQSVPREQLIARFFEVGEEIRQEAISKGTAIEGDAEGD